MQIKYKTAAPFLQPYAIKTQRLAKMEAAKRLPLDFGYRSEPPFS
jgi:hypothetical protein